MSTTFLTVAAILCVIVLLTLLGSYNALIDLRRSVRAAWGRMDERIKNRTPAVSALIQFVQNSGGEAALKVPPVSAARNQSAVAMMPNQLAAAETALSAAIADLLATAEKQGLNADARFAQLRQQVIDAEQRLTLSIFQYNDLAHQLNLAMTTFPCVLIAKLIGMHLQPLFGAGMATQ